MIKPRPQWNHCADSGHRKTVTIGRADAIGRTREEASLVGRVIMLKRQQERQG